MIQQEIILFLEKFANGTITVAEQEEFMELISTLDLKEYEQILESYQGILKHYPVNSITDADLLAKIENRIDKYEKPNTIVTLFSTWGKIAAAASILLFISIGGYFLWHKQAPGKQIVHNQPLHNDIAPGGNKAILILASGKQIVLTGAKNGTLAKQGAITISKTSNGQVVYTDASTAAQNTAFISYNSIETPRGGQYHLTLADGTNVWLNAASSIKYPTAFTGNERRVEITGEAYFEVKHDAAKPFRVICNGQIVEDLGTHFNINAYSDESAVKTTLLEGSVAVTSVGKNKILKPGEQAQLENGDIHLANVDVDEMVAWKNGLFDFKDANIGIVMRQLARWYDVDVEYEGKIPDILFTGKLHRDINAAQILDMLSYFKVHFKIENEGVKKKIIVMP
ncbi:FecR family protein [Mucilaginibacter mallensis]|uniref:FecR family protein n=1 Tax=Mucilaginibacter mallensis TaxID=652787 RepID=A0A1H1RDA2_MUCMA|nr:FecR family protein [Mucilaginibacter mallensis]SDS33672.1 FecR family protein [Mucilaginibacter mallensis]